MSVRSSQLIKLYDDPQCKTEVDGFHFDEVAEHGKPISKTLHIRNEGKHEYQILEMNADDPDIMIESSAKVLYPWKPEPIKVKVSPSKDREEIINGKLKIKGRFIVR